MLGNMIKSIIIIIIIIMKGETEGEIIATPGTTNQILCDKNIINRNR